MDAYVLGAGFSRAASLEEKRMNGSEMRAPHTRSQVPLVR